MPKIFRVTIDTNIFISMLLGSKNCLAIYEAFVKGNIDLLISEELFVEIVKVLKRDSFTKIISKHDIKELKNLLSVDAEWVGIKNNLLKCRDPKDNIVLETAISGKVDFIITGDKDLLEFNPFQHIPIVTPKQFIEYL